jgi:hypothetical protein
LTQALKPTRKSVLGFDYMRIRIGGEWWSPSAPYENEDAVDDNRGVTQKFLDSLPFRDNPGHKLRSDIMRHRVAMATPLKRALEDLLTKYRVVSPEDSAVYTTLLLSLRAHLERKQDASCDIYWMSAGAIRERSVDASGGIVNLFQGAHPNKEGKIYPGDRSIRADDRVTIQIHNLSILKDGKVIESNVPTLAIWVPKEIAPDTIVQDQLGSGA